MHVNVDKIFGLFDNEDETPKSNSDVNQDMSYLLEDYKQHPMFWVGMFKKLIYNHQSFSDKILNSFKDLDGELDMNDVENAGEFIVYNRAWYWINKIDIKEQLHQNALTHYADEILLTYTKVVILYFQELEEYEKCAHLKKVQDFLESLLK